MKRSQINHIILNSIDFMQQMNFKLPPWAYWPPEKWKGKYEICREIVDNMLGWDVTSFDSNDFYTRGLMAFTIRNGNIQTKRKIYGEKIMIVEENQETPMHFHWSKMEDIINRGGGNLVLELYGSTPEEDFSSEPLNVQVDGITRTVPPGGSIILTPGESICLEQGMYHRFFGEPGKGKVLVGEVSSVNDDTIDNRWYENLGRFPTVEEDESPVHLLVSDYTNFI